MVRLWRRDRIGSEADRATFRTLHTAALAGPPLRNGLTKTSAERAIKHLRSLLGAPAIAITLGQFSKLRQQLERLQAGQSYREICSLHAA